MNQPVFQRLHPLTILVESWRAIRQFLLAFIIVGFSAATGRGSDFSEVILSGLGLVVGATALVRYFTYSFAIHNGVLLVRQGLVTKQARTIPLDRIQNINIKRDLIHRLLGLADLEIETAAGAKAEAVLSAVTEEQAHLIKQQLLGQANVAASPIIEKRREELIYAASPKELFWAGATENKLGFIIVSLLGLFTFAPGLQERLLKDGIKKLSDGGLLNPAQYLFWIGLFLAALLVGWLFSIASTFVSYWGFEVGYKDGRFRRAYGMFNHFENVVPLRRVQVVRYHDNLLQRWLGMGKLSLETAGSYSEKGGGEGETRAAARPTSLIAPLIHVSAIAPILQKVVPGFVLDTAHWNALSPKTVPVRVLSSIWFALILGAGAFWFYRPWGLLAIPAWLLLQWGLGVWEVRTTRWHDDGDRISVSHGLFWRSMLVAPVDKVQAVWINQSPWQRRFGLARLTVLTAAGQGSRSIISIHGMPSAEAADVAESLHRRSGLSAWKNPDGF